MNISEKFCSDWDTRVNVLAPRHLGLSLSGFMQALALADDGPFSEIRLEMLGGLSGAILRHPLLRRSGAGVALAYWLRRSNLSLFKAAYERLVKSQPGALLLPAGLVFHIAPANVDTMFLYSWALSFLCGNANVVRLSQGSLNISDALLECLNDMLCRYEIGSPTNLFVSYPHTDELTAEISRVVSLRVVWGGNETIARVRAIPMNPHGAERSFSSKFSFAVLKAATYLEARETARADLASRFFSDLFAYDQMACSSPHLVLWKGNEHEIEDCCWAFDNCLAAEVGRRAIPLNIPQALRRLDFAFGQVADGRVEADWSHSGFMSLRWRGEGNCSRLLCGGGLFTHGRLGAIEDLAGFVNDGDQTITHFGFTPAELLALARVAGARGADRLVPIGEALRFEANWDGYNLIHDFLRTVVVRADI